MISVSAVEFLKFAEKNNWIVIDKSDEDDLKLDDDYLRYLTPQGKTVLVRFWGNGSIKKII